MIKPTTWSVFLNTQVFLGGIVMYFRFSDLINYWCIHTMRQASFLYSKSVSTLLRSYFDNLLPVTEVHFLYYSFLSMVSKSVLYGMPYDNSFFTIFENYFKVKWCFQKYWINNLFKFSFFRFSSLLIKTTV